jgi:ABC-type phosphate/phosphonate transport system substrate-binding protein
MRQNSAVQSIRVTLAGASLAALALAACSSGSSGSSTTTTPRDQTCAARTQLQKSVRALGDLDASSGRDAITKAFDQVRTNLDTLGQSVKAELQPQVQDVRNALEQLQTDVGAIGNTSPSDSLEKVGKDIAAVGSTTGKLVDSLQAGCPS